MMKKSMFAGLVLLFATAWAFGQTQNCFENKGLKGISKISFTVKGNKIADGRFETSVYDESSPNKEYAFSGTKVGSNLDIKFAGEIPDEFSKIKKIRWVLGKSLKVQLYGKNYQTNKWGIYAATFEECESQPSENSDSMMDKPKRIVFAKGKSEATEKITLAADESKQFVVAGKIGQIFYVDSESKDLKISMIKGKIATNATMVEPGHYDTTLLANGDFVFAIENNSKNEVKSTFLVIISNTHSNQ